MPRKKSRSRCLQPSPQVQTGAAPLGPPRINKYSALLSRFYEHLTVLYEYDPVRGGHTPENREKGLGGFLDDLAFLCEHAKGGDACSAIGIEDAEECFVYWVAANEDPKKKIAPFLKKILDILKSTLSLTAENRQKAEEQLLDECLQHAAKKVKELRRLLMHAISDCKSRVEDSLLLSWLEAFETKQEYTALCRLAYDSRKTNGMKRLQDTIESPTYQRTPDERRSPFNQARHYIGRLAHFIRTVKRLVEEAPLVEDLLTNPFRVQPIPISKCVSPPPPDNLTTLEGVCIRMVRSKHDPKLPVLQAEFQKRNILEKLVNHHDNPKQPRVHAEIQVLEFFCQKQLRWAKNSKYIGCSKAACFCCQRYFRHHPAKPREPASHQKVWLSWGPALLENGCEDPNYIHQRDILNEIIKDIRKEVFTQIQEARGPHTWHHDTRTDITRSLADDEPEYVSALAQELNSLKLQEQQTQGLSLAPSMPQVLICDRTFWPCSSNNRYSWTGFRHRIA